MLNMKQQCPHQYHQHWGGNKTGATIVFAHTHHPPRAVDHTALVFFILFLLIYPGLHYLSKTRNHQQPCSSRVRSWGARKVWDAVPLVNHQQGRHIDTLKTVHCPLLSLKYHIPHTPQQACRSKKTYTPCACSTIRQLCTPRVSGRGEAVRHMCMCLCIPIRCWGALVLHLCCIVVQIQLWMFDHPFQAYRQG